ncbi:hypothetical protein [Hyphomicrobium sp.]|uniref:hypothetical protein n=1 Tax=Hyphomicrobium sp. TaxID=82 RepID=UPI002D7914A2|nr:hypothetical protein [Hyphomicrobium sp.]HET6391004.1 hypothetical protein [Hyphomicrobium sp.]
MKTGTARYLGLFIGEGGATLKSREAFIVTPSGFAEVDKTYMGLPVITDKQYSPQADDVVVAFFANNRFHQFAYPLINKRKKWKKLISVLHDPQCFMNVESMHWSPSTGCDTEALYEHIRHEMPTLHRWTLEKWSQYKLPSIMKYNLIAQSKVLPISDSIVVHSYYAGLKLSLESAHGVSLPEIVVMQHPRDTEVISTNVKAEKFSVGCFGWISQAKRPLSVIEGFGRFFSGLPEDARKSVQLKFVGELSEKSLDPLFWSKAYGFPSNCVHLGHVSDQVFSQEMASTNLVFNLRFPSCGESSGALNLASDLGVKIALSSYQAFREETADYLIKLDPKQEVNDIVAAITKEYKNWLNKNDGLPNRRKAQYPTPRKFDVPDAISYLLEDV